MQFYQVKRMIRAKKALSQAGMRFKMAREKATEAFNNDALSTFDRITAVRYRVMATMLQMLESAVETVVTPDRSALEGIDERSLPSV